MPFADGGGQVAELAQRVGERRDVLGDERAVGPAQDGGAQRGTPWVPAREEGISAGCAYGRRRMGIREPVPPGGQPVEDGRGERGRAVAREVGVTQVVGDDEDD